MPKVSRAKADMQSLSTALESYAVDYNVYPSNNYFQFISIQITTPVNYITSLPQDPFANPYTLTTSFSQAIEINSNNNSQALRYHYSAFYYLYEASTDLPPKIWTDS